MAVPQREHNDQNDNITDSESFTFKTRITTTTSAAGSTKDAEIAVHLKYLGNVWRTLKMSLNNCEINLLLTWSVNCVIINSTGAGTFAITDTKLCVPLVTLLAQDNIKLLQQLK